MAPDTPVCPECGGTFTIDTTALVEEAYVPCISVRGEVTLPTRLRPAVVGFCDCCPFSIEIRT